MKSLQIRYLQLSGTSTETDVTKMLNPLSRHKPAKKRPVIVCSHDIGVMDDPRHSCTVSWHEKQEQEIPPSIVYVLHNSHTHRSYMHILHTHTPPIYMWHQRNTCWAALNKDHQCISGRFVCEILLNCLKNNILGWWEFMSNAQYSTATTVLVTDVYVLASLQWFFIL